MLDLIGEAAILKGSLPAVSKVRVCRVRSPGGQQVAATLIRTAQVLGGGLQTSRWPGSPR